MEEKYPDLEESTEKRVGKKLKTYEQSRLPETVSLTFKGTRKFELHIGRKIYIFMGRETHPLPRSVLEHKDFTEKIKEYFVIGE